MYKVLPLGRVVPILKFDLPSGRADEVNRKALFDEGARSPDGGRAHSHGGNLITRGVLRCPIGRVSDLGAVERHVGGHHRCGVRETADALRHRVVRRAARVDRVLHAPPRRGCVVGAGTQEHRQPLGRAGNGVVAYYPSANAEHECCRAQQHATVHAPAVPTVCHLRCYLCCRSMAVTKM